MYRLVITDGKNINRVPLPTKDVISIGRSAQNDIVIDARSVSREHVRIEHTEKGLRLVDVGSKNRIFHQGIRVHEIDLTPQTSFGLGKLTLRIEEIPEDDATVYGTVLSKRASRLSAESTFDTDPFPTPYSESSPAAALAWTVEAAAHRGKPLPEKLFDDARQILGAHTIVAVETVGSTAVVTAIAGQPLDSGDIERLVSGKAPSSSWLSLRNERVVVAARLGETSKAWHRAFLAAVAATINFHHPHHTRASSAKGFAPDKLIASSSAMKRVVDELAKLAATHVSLLLVGEPGTGKEVIARAVHDFGPTKGRPFLAVNCAALTPELLAAELFGTTRGVATGVDERDGLFIKAGRGTLFLDEIGDMPVELQVKLLRALEERAVRPVGGTKEMPFEARIISATNQPLPQRMREQTFRADLYRRLGLVVTLPPLRARREEILPLAVSFGRAAADEHGRFFRGFTNKAVTALQAYHWPGNVRELKNLVVRAVLHATDDGVIDSNMLRFDEAGVQPSLSGAPARTFDEAERDNIALAMAEGGDLQKDVATVLGIDRQRLRRLMKKHNLR